MWLYPTGWADVGYSAAEVVVKEVAEETGIEVEPIRLVAVFDGLRLGARGLPFYSLVFHCRAGRWKPAAASARGARRRLVRRGRPARARWPAAATGSSWPSGPSGASSSTWCSTRRATVHLAELSRGPA